jgi:hypothetical protein
VGIETGSVPETILPTDDYIQVAKGDGFKVEARQGVDKGRVYVQILVYTGQVFPEHPDYYASCESKNMWLPE